MALYAVWQQKDLSKQFRGGESFSMVVNIEPLSLETSSIIANMTIGEVILL